MDSIEAKRFYQLYWWEFDRLKKLDNRRKKRIEGATTAFKAVALSLLLSAVPPVSWWSQGQNLCFDWKLAISEMDENWVSSKVCLEPIISPVLHTFDIPWAISSVDKELYLTTWYDEYLEFETPEYRQEALLEDVVNFPDEFFHQANKLISLESFDTLYFQLLVDLYFFAPMFWELSQQEKIEFLALKEELYSHVPNIWMLPSPEWVEL